VPNDDCAIVAGVSRYPGLSDLGGPVNDALAFRDWLVEPDGGGLDPANVEIILSPDPFPGGGDPSIAPPTSDQIAAAFRRLQARGKGLALGKTIGRRLYIFLAGHGFSPDKTQPALLTANADEDNLFHVPGRAYAEWFKNRAWFDEVVLVMDCCREQRAVVPLEVIWPDRNSPKGPSKRFFYVFAAQKGSVALERPFPEDGDKVHGLVSWALMKGLRGAARDPSDGGRITGRSQKGFVTNHVKALAGAADGTDVRGDAAPDVSCSDFDDAVVFAVAPAALPATTWPVSILLTPESQGKVLQIVDGRTRNPDGSLEVLFEDQPAGDRWRLQIPDKGFYKVQVKGGTAFAFFEVPSAGGDNAQL
jgi:hypothetical protein